MEVRALVNGTQAAGTALLVGLVVIDPTARMRSAPDWAGWVRGQQRVDRVMSRVAPPLFLSTTLATGAGAVLALAGHRPGGTAGRLLATGFLVASIRVTLARNEPVNRQIRAWHAEAVPPPGWQGVRRRWEAAHRTRRVLLAGAALTSLLGVAVDRARRG